MKRALVSFLDIFEERIQFSFVWSRLQFFMSNKGWGIEPQILNSGTSTSLVVQGLEVWNFAWTLLSTISMNGEKPRIVKIFLGSANFQPSLPGIIWQSIPSRTFSIHSVALLGQFSIMYCTWLHRLANYPLFYRCNNPKIGILQVVFELSFNFDFYITIIHLFSQNIQKYSKNSTYALLLSNNGKKYRSNDIVLPWIPHQRKNCG
jgi:hypothetical protein